MIRLAASMTILLVSCVSVAGAESPRDRLGWLIGTWTIEGRESSFTEVCDWFHHRSHVVCNSESRGTSGVRKGVSVISYSDLKKRFLYYHYGSSGVAVEMDVFIEGHSLMATAERLEGDDLVREQVWMTPTPDGSADFREDVSKNGGPWETRTRFRYLRVLPSPDAANEKKPH